MIGRLALVVAIALAGCVPQLQESTADGNHIVTTWSRLFGLKATRWNNVEVARATCPDGYILLNETIGRDANGNFRRWEYGCLAP